MESEETHRQEGLATSWQAPASLLPGILARLEQRQTAVKGLTLDALGVQLAHAQWEVRAAAVRALSEYTTQTAQDANTLRALMLQALQDEHRLVHVAAIRALSRLDAGIPFDRLLLSLRDPDWEVREMAVLMLGELSDQRLDPLQALLEVAQQDTHSSVREAAAYALQTYRDVQGLGVDAHIGAIPIDAQESCAEGAPPAMKTSSQKNLRREVAVGSRRPQGSRRDKPIFYTSFHTKRAEDPNRGAYPHTPCTPGFASMGTIPWGRPGQGQTAAPTGMVVRLWSFLKRYLSIFVRQTPLIHKSIWFVSPLLLVLWFVQNALFLGGVGGNIHEAGLFLALFATISAGAGSAFLYGAERDAAFELTLSTPTSLRLLMLCRFVLVVGYNILLAGGASAALVLLYGGGFWDVMQLWLGPVLLISSLSLMLAMLLGSVLALSMAFLLEASQSLAFSIVGHTSMLEFSFSQNWQTSPILLLLAVLSLTAALFYAPRQVRLLSQS